MNNTKIDKPGYIFPKIIKPFPENISFKIDHNYKFVVINTAAYQFLRK